MPGNHCLQTGDCAEHLRPPGLDGCLDLGERCQGDLLLAAAGSFLLRQGSKEAEPVQRVFF